MTPKRCYTPIYCPYQSHCEHGNVHRWTEIFEPRNVGEFCDVFKPLVVPESDLADLLAQRAGALE